MTASASTGRSRTRSRRDPQPSPVSARVVATVVIATIVAAAPIALVLRAPEEGRPDPGVLLAILVGSGIGAAIYWSLPQRPAGRRRSQAGRRLVATAGWSFLGGMVLSFSGTLSTNSAGEGVTFGSAIAFALWCAGLAAVTASLLRQPRRPIGRQRTHSESAYANYSARPFARPDTRATPQGSPSLERECPWCAEQVLSRAKVCKHCGRDIEPLT